MAATNPQVPSAVATSTGGRKATAAVPLVTAPRGPEGVAYRKRRAGVEARQRTKARAEGDGYRLSQRCRRKIEEAFGRLKGVAGLDRSRTVGRWKLQQALEPAAAACNLVRLRKLAPAG